MISSTWFPKVKGSSSTEERAAGGIRYKREDLEIPYWTEQSRGPWGQRKVVTKLFSVLQTDLRITCFSVSLGVRCSFTKCRFPSPSLDLVNTIL